MVPRTVRLRFAYRRSTAASAVTVADSCAPNTWCVVYYNPPSGALNIAVALCARLQ